MGFITPEIIGGIVRAVLASAGGFAIAKGWITPENWEPIAGGVLATVISLWSAKTKV